jgi:LCP family protein required for cell wall assembly
MAKGKKQKNPMGVKNGLLLTLSILLIVCSVLLAGYTSLMSWTPLPDVVETTNEDGTVISTSQAVIDEDIKTPETVQGRAVNFLVAGIDYNTIDATAGVSRGKLTDVIMVVQIDLEEGSVRALQFPRDTWVGTNRSSTGKINAIYSSYGISGLAEVIYDQFALTIDHYVTVDMNGFIQIVDAIGGVTMDIDESFTLEGITFSPGTQTLSGIEAEKFVRERHSRSGGDIGRINAQRKFLAALFSEMKDLSASELTNLAPVIMQNVTTDLSVGTALSLVQEILDMDTSNMSFYTVDGTTGTAYNGQSIWRVYKDNVADTLNENFRPYTDPVSADELLVDGTIGGYSAYETGSATISELLGEDEDDAA